MEFTQASLDTALLGFRPPRFVQSSLSYFIRRKPHPSCDTKLVSNKMATQIICWFDYSFLYSWSFYYRALFLQTFKITVKYILKLLCCCALYGMPVSMKPTRFSHSLKKIPLPSEKDYNWTLIEKTELLCKWMRWKAFFFLNLDEGGNKKETFGFNLKTTPLQITEILNFAKRLQEASADFLGITQIQSIVVIQ